MPHFDRHTDLSGATQLSSGIKSGKADEAAMDIAAEALREAEIEAVTGAPEPSPAQTFDTSSINAAELERMNIDELRVLAKELDIPDRATITETDDLIAEIRERL